MCHREWQYLLLSIIIIIGLPLSEVRENAEASLTSIFQTQMDNMVARGTKRVRFAYNVNGEGAETHNA